MDYQVVAAGLKYLGLIVGTASLFGGVLTEPKKGGPDGRKVLTRPGKISIAVDHNQSCGVANICRRRGETCSAER